MHGLEKGVVLVVAYDSEWPAQYALEAARLRKLIGGLVLDIQHVGSTSVPGCEAKPIIDIAVSISDEGKVAECVPLLAGLGYTYKGENGIPGRHYFQRGEPACLFHLHMSTPEHPNWVNMLRFREHLRRHPETLRAYCQLKHDLAARYPNNREAYTEGKAAFIQSILEEQL